MPSLASKLLHPRDKHVGVVFCLLPVLASQTRSPAGQARRGLTCVEQRGQRPGGNGPNEQLVGPTGQPFGELLARWADR